MNIPKLVKTYSTVTDWVAKLITPLYEALQKGVLACNYLQADESPIKVLERDRKCETHRSYYWVYHNSLKDLVFFDYQPGHGLEESTEMLRNFKCYLQIDGYVAYYIFNEYKDVTIMHYMAHARNIKTINPGFFSAYFDVI